MSSIAPNGTLALVSMPVTGSTRGSYTKLYIPKIDKDDQGKSLAKASTTASELVVQPDGEAFNHSVNELQFFLPKFSNLWIAAQKKLYSNPPSYTWENDLNEFYRKLWAKLPQKSRIKINQKTYEHFNSSFLDLNLEEKLAVLKSIKTGNHINGTDFGEFTKNVFYSLEQDEQDNIIRAGLFMLGDVNKEQKLMPYIVRKRIQLLLEDSAYGFLKSLNDNRVKYLGRGSIGMGFAIDIDGNQFLLKLPISQDASPAYKTFIYEEEQLKKYEEILDKYSAQNPPEKDFIPRLVKDSNGKYIGLKNQVIVMKYYDGQKITQPIKSPSDEKLNPESKQELTYETPGDYIKMGLDDDFLVDYIGFYLRFTKEGADLGDISPWNYLHSGTSLSLFELAGFDPGLPGNSGFKFIAEHSKKYPEAFCIYSLLTSILTFENGSRGGFQRKLIADKARDSLAIKTEDEFFGHRIGQLARVLQKSVHKKVISHADLKKGVEELKSLLDKNKDRRSFTLTKRGYDYLIYLKDLINSDNFLRQIIG